MLWIIIDVHIVQFESLIAWQGLNHDNLVPVQMRLMTLSVWSAPTVATKMLIMVLNMALCVEIKFVAEVSCGHRRCIHVCSCVQVLLLLFCVEGLS